MPVVTTLIPMVILISARYVEVPFGTQFWNLIISQTVALHSPLNTIAVLLSTRHYLKTVNGIFKCALNRMHGSKTVPSLSAKNAVVE
ncbi:hypothetical protein OESDEN_13902 [Oesophagostomum dentatum]|uniref:G-protein coupled receptors family 1 profile domain-containing protein n=1 Tax=Oesophagostomum dentatum TaxID=61180 RepID=A0A0B1SR24_OESDE|nr:hypothetical protein OESDEN_13902 [Oesophagostomum dentatum]